MTEREQREQEREEAQARARAAWLAIPEEERKKAQKEVGRAMKMAKVLERTMRKLTVGQIIRRRHATFPNHKFIDTPEGVMK